MEADQAHEQQVVSLPEIEKDKNVSSFNLLNPSKFMLPTASPPLTITRTDGLPTSHRQIQLLAVRA